jgi:hypothetical protein
LLKNMGLTSHYTGAGIGRLSLLARHFLARPVTSMLDHSIVLVDSQRLMGK